MVLLLLEGSRCGWPFVGPALLGSAPPTAALDQGDKMEKSWIICFYVFSVSFKVVHSLSEHCLSHLCLRSFVKSSKLSVSRLHKGTPS